MSILTLKFEAQAKKIERTHSFEGVCTDATPYKTKTDLKGIAFTIKGCPYKLRLLTNELPAKFLYSTVLLTGTMRTYDGKDYFDAKDITITEQSALGKLAQAGISYAGVI